MPKRRLEVRSMPTLLEQRNTVIESMENLLKKANEETRALDENEQNQFNQYKEEIGKLDSTMEAQRYAEELAKKQNASVSKPSTQVTPPNQQEEQRMLAEDNFLKFIRGEERALDVAGNGGIIPTIISDRIIQKVKELCPIYAQATVFNVGGDLVFPKFDYTTINTSFIADMTALTPQNGNFTTVKLQNFIAGSLVQISRSLINRQDFDLTSFIVNMMAMSIADFIENQLLNGVGTTAPLGIFKDPAVTVVTAASATAITFDDLISVQMSVPEQFQANAVWVMHKNTFMGLRKLKDTTGQYLLSSESSPSQISGFGWTMLGRPVYFSENAPSTQTTGLPIVCYGDMSGLYVKLAQQVEIAILNELYATSHATGVVGYVEFDARVVETQKIARLKMA